MIEKLIKLLRKLEGEAESILSDLHHLRAVVQTDLESGTECQEDYILEILDHIINRME